MRIPAVNFLTALYRLYRKGYQALGHTCDELRSDIFEIRIPGQPVICLRGEAAAKVFYDPEKMQRKGAVPQPVQQTLTGRQAIHTSDGQVHQQRKAMFLSLMTDRNIEQLTHLFKQELHKRVAEWQNMPSVNVFEEMARALCVAVCSWAGVPLRQSEVNGHAADFVAMIDAFGTVGLRNWKGRRARKRTERWIGKIIADARNGRMMPTPGTALDIVTAYREPSGKLLDNRMAAIELINVLRPTVAITWYIVFGAVAMHEYPECERKFLESDDTWRLHFVDEVRRFYPFAPFMGARVRQTFNWQGYFFPQGTLVLLDMYGTNHDARLWEQPDTFNPDRFVNRQIRPFDFLAQGGGDVASGHRCPGEKITVALLKAALQFLTGEIVYNVPEQDFSISLSRMPALPKSRMELTNVRKSFAYAS